MEREFKEYIKLFIKLSSKYNQELNTLQSNFSETINKKVSEQVIHIFKKHGLTDIEKIMILSSLSEAIFDSTINKFSIDNNDKKDIEALCIHIKKETKEKELNRTIAMGVINSFYDKKQKNFDLGDKNSFGIMNKKRFTVLEKHNFSCFYCGKKPPEVELEIDHIIPKAKGGSNELSNLVPACRECNRGKSARVLKNKYLNVGFINLLC